DDLKYIGSGPTIAQKISFTDAISVSKKYHILKKYPSTVQKHLNNGLAGEDRGHLNNSTSDIENHDTYVVSSANKVANRAKELLEKRGFNTTLIEPAWEGLIDDFEKKIMKQIESLPAKANQKKALLFYGECTIQIQGNGLGGRNQELALRMSKHLKKFDQHQREIVFLSAGTDGIDGPTDVAGAVVDQKTYQNAVDIGLDPVDFIQNNDSYHFFKKIGGHITTGPTGNNVMDLQIVLIGE
ncbi:MAG: MOFRL family protein, partial [Balneolaceae bacterium]